MPHELLGFVLAESSEWPHVALVALQYGAIGIGTIVWWFYRRSRQRSDDAMAAITKKLTEHDAQLASHDRQIRDVRAANEGPRAKLNLGPYPYTD